MTLALGVKALDSPVFSRPRAPLLATTVASALYSGAKLGEENTGSG